MVVGEERAERPTSSWNAARTVWLLDVDHIVVELTELT